MCLNPRKILNPKRKFSTIGGHQLYLLVPCGKCAECQQKKVDEYLLRSYYESLDCFLSGGFVLFDTFTYDNQNVPYLSDFFDVDEKSDFMCFSYMDWRLFMVRLRERLVREGYDINGKLLYFVTSEYGTSEGYSHRPHYHIIFFVYFDIDPFYFSRCLSDCWQKGRTDGIPFKSRQYVLSKRLFSFRYNADMVHLQSVVSYVAKYICKQSSYQNIVDNRILRFMDSNYGLSWRNDPDNKELFKQLTRYTSQFHRQSQGFGISALKYNSINDVVKSGMLSMPDSKCIVKRIPIPMYYSRKLFYTLTKDFRGKPQWQLSSEGCQMMLNKFEDGVERLSFKFSDWFSNLHQYIDDPSYIRDKFTSVLGNRSYHDLARYILGYKGRVLPADYSSSSVDPPSLDYFLPLSLESGCSAYLYNSPDEPIKIPSVSSVWYGDKDNPKEVPKNPLIVPLSDYAQNHIINQSTFKVFNGFDDLFDLYSSTLFHRAVTKQNSFDLKQHLKDVYKSLQTNNSPFCLT